MVSSPSQYITPLRAPPRRVLSAPRRPIVLDTILRESYNDTPTKAKAVPTSPQPFMVMSPTSFVTPVRAPASKVLGAPRRPTEFDTTLRESYHDTPTKASAIPKCTVTRPVPSFSEVLESLESVGFNEDEKYTASVEMKTWQKLTPTKAAVVGVHTMPKIVSVAEIQTTRSNKRKSNGPPRCSGFVSGQTGGDPFALSPCSQVAVLGMSGMDHKCEQYCRAHWCGPCKRQARHLARM